MAERPDIKHLRCSIEHWDILRQVAQAKGEPLFVVVHRCLNRGLLEEGPLEDLLPELKPGKRTRVRSHVTD